MIRYIEQNPVRAKLLKREEDYKCSSARVHILGIRDDLLSKESWFNDKGIKSCEKFLHKDAKEINVSIRRATSTGMQLGN